jgi:hypothetical protein
MRTETSSPLISLTSLHRSLFALIAYTAVMACAVHPSSAQATHRKPVQRTIQQEVPSGIVYHVVLRAVKFDGSTRYVAHIQSAQSARSPLRSTEISTVRPVVQFDDQPQGQGFGCEVAYSQQGHSASSTINADMSVWTPEDLRTCSVLFRAANQ